MNDVLRIDTETIGQAAHDLGRIKATLDNSQTDATALSGMIPVAGLRSAAVDFSVKWEITRKEMVEEIEQLKQQLDSIVSAFEETETGLAKVLNDDSVT